jgi:hypothetical protein
MDATCAGCDRMIFDSSRVCEHCGHRIAEPLLLPAFALSLHGEPGQDTLLDGFDFPPENSSEPHSAASTDLESFDEVPFELFAQQELEPLTPDLEPLTEEVFARAPPEPSLAAEAPSEPYVSVSSNGLLFGASPDATRAGASERSKRRDIVSVTLAAAISGILTLGWLLARTAPGAEVTVAAATESIPPTAASAAKPAVRDSAPARQWTAANSTVWAGDLKNAVAFELEAENTVGIWMRTVRPALIVRCTRGAVEVFVFTASAARIEPQNDDHTVQVSFDGASETTGRWRDSEEHDALFAPDGGAFVQQLLSARVLRFGFTPHNASPVNANFNVAGLSGILAPAARQCGVKQ